MSIQVAATAETHFYILTHSYLETAKGSLANNAGPDQTPHNVASDQGLQYLLTGFSINIRIITTK